MRKLLGLLLASTLFVCCAKEDITSSVDNISSNKEYESLGEKKDHTYYLTYVDKNDFYQVNGNVATLKYHIYNHNVNNKDFNFDANIKIKNESGSKEGKYFTLDSSNNVTFFNENIYTNISQSLINTNNPNHKILFIVLEFKDVTPHSFGFDLNLKDIDNFQTKFVSRIKFNIPE